MYTNNAISLLSRCLVAMMERYFPRNYLGKGLIGAQVDQLVLKEIIQEKLPNLAEHLNKMNVDISTITLNWFIAIFIEALTFDVSKN
ncbi:unnamed protein product [Protopolystoma xenopodis]|uniref:Rab-GAP TBC domain-containing protein n=1 Tax=Protopolystoma xenopodis TaxID=117903 RepID=A0A448X5H5_9PLAT|nr:unnamed protein product [Protopolystoma xenopodis]